MSASPMIWTPGQAQRPVAREAPARAIGKPHGSYIAGLAEQRQTIWLCMDCEGRFDHRRSHYHRERDDYRVIGNCDACRELTQQNRLFVHESYLTGTGGRSHNGCSWIPR